MRKLILILIISFATTISVFGQSISHEDFQNLISLMQKEDFKTAYQKTSELLTSTPYDDSDERGLITYMNISSATGLVALGEITYDKFIDSTKKFIGQHIVMPSHPCISPSDNGFNSIKFVPNDDGELEGRTITTNRKGINILSFEYFRYAKPINVDETVGKNIRSGGTLESIETNPNKSTIWIARLRVKDAFARVVTSE